MITQSRLKEMLEYDPETGLFTRKISCGYRGCHRAGEIVGSIRADGYVIIRIDGVSYYAHRLAWFYVHGVWPEFDTDHIDLKTSNNRIVNLRPATRSENKQNRVAAQKNNINTGILGVHFINRSGLKNKYAAKIKINGKQKSLGYYSTPELAHAAYVLAKRELHPYGTL